MDNKQKDFENKVIKFWLAMLLLAFLISLGCGALVALFQGAF